jgi:hypothetical protein
LTKSSKEVECFDADFGFMMSQVSLPMVGWAKVVLAVL